MSKLTDAEIASLMIDRDVSQFRVERIDKLLNQIGEAKGYGDEAKAGHDSEADIDPSKLFWEEKQGQKSPFQQTSEKANSNSEVWQSLRSKLKEHDGFWQHRGFRYWFDMKNESVVDRRKIS